MKFRTSALALCLLASSQLKAQSGSNSLTPLSSLAVQFGMDRMNQPASGLPSPYAKEAPVISLKRLQHSVDKHALRLSRKGMQDYLQHRYQEALPLLQAAVAIDSTSSMLENNLGVIYCALGNDKSAQQAFEKAVQADPSAATSYTNLAAVSFNIYQYPEAEMSARQALRLDPRCPQAKVMLGLAEVAQNHWTREAREYLRENRAHFPQAELILEHWPTADRKSTDEPAVTVRGPGPGAFAKTLTLKDRE